jgi:PEGA domain
MNNGERAMAIRAVLIGACGLTLAGCASSVSSISGFFQSSPKTEQLRIESDPEGAEAKNPEGATCQTPCEFSVPSGTDISITVSMVGYQTLTVSITPESSGGQLLPNPVFAKLQPLVPPPSARKPPAKKKSVQASTAQ